MSDDEVGGFNNDDVIDSIGSAGEEEVRVFVSHL
jgi:hypothetical protein